MVTKEEDPKYLIEIVNCIVHYYTYCQLDDIDPSEEWKRNTDLIKQTIPKELDGMVKTAFIKKLKQHT